MGAKPVDESRLNIVGMPAEILRNFRHAAGRWLGPREMSWAGAAALLMWTEAPVEKQQEYLSRVVNVRLATEKLSEPAGAEAQAAALVDEAQRAADAERAAGDAKSAGPARRKRAS
jgi:hypothetical protein